MEQFIKYIEKELPSKNNNELLYKFKRSVLDEMNERYSEVMKRGITDTKVLTDLVISEHPNLRAEYEKFKINYTAKDRSKKRLIINVAGSIIYLFSLIVVFLGVSFVTQKWSMTWLIPVDGILLWVAYIMQLAVSKIHTFKKIFHIFARLLFSGEIMIISVAVFLFVLRFTGHPKSWLIIIGGVASMFITDAMYAVITRKRLAIINILLYIPVIAAMAYIILAALGIITWVNGWTVILLSLLLDFVIVAVKINVNKKKKQEVIDTWEES